MSAPVAKTVNGIAIDDTFAEAFGMSATSLVITADTPKWAMICAQTMTGFGTSVIGCGAECGIDREMSPSETPDGRPGVRVLMFGFSPDALVPQIKNRVGQCVLTSPGSACYNGLLDAPKRMGLASGPRFFGDGWQTAKLFGKRRFWRVPVMDGEFIIEDKCGVTTEAVGGGNLLIIGTDRAGVLETTEAAVTAIAKVARRHHALPRRHRPLGLEGRLQICGRRCLDQRRLRARAARRNQERTQPRHALGPRNRHRRADIASRGADPCASASRPSPTSAPAKGVTRVSAGNYGGKLGQHHYHLKDLLA